MADFDGDADLDLLLLTTSIGQVPRLYVNDGSGVFSIHGTPLPSVARYQYSAVTLDVEGDGDIDVFLGNSEVDNQDQLLLNDGSGQFSLRPGAIPLNPAGTGAAVAVDVDLDGDLDLVIGNERTNVLINDGTGTFVDQTSARLYSMGGYFISMEAADFDGNGTTDCLAVWRSAELWLNAGGVFLNDARFREDQYLPRDMVPADVDGDGDADLVSTSFRSHHIVHFNDGTGYFRRSVGPRASNQVAGSYVNVGDFDGDGDVDLIAEEFAENDGTGQFTLRPGRIVPAGFFLSPARERAVVDVDLDGDLDLVRARDYTQSGGFRWGNEILVNDGSANFVSWSLPYVALDCLCVAVGDVDSDGDPDLYFGAANSPGLLMLNEGPLFFRDVSALLPSGLSMGLATAAKFVDVDGDGDLDLAISTAEGTPNRLLLGDGTGTFQLAPRGLPDNLDGASDLEAVDIDLDGDQDLMISYRRSIQVPTRGAELLLNDGVGTFRYVSLPEFERDATTHLRLADVDGDGDVDVLRLGATHLVGINLVRQLHSRRVPRSGRSFALDVYGKTGFAAGLQGALIFVSDRFGTPFFLPGARYLVARPRGFVRPASGDLVRPGRDGQRDDSHPADSRGEPDDVPGSGDLRARVANAFGDTLQRALRGSHPLRKSGEISSLFPKPMLLEGRSIGFSRTSRSFPERAEAGRHSCEGANPVPSPRTGT